jgi:hypothetical protein
MLLFRGNSNDREFPSNKYSETLSMIPFHDLSASDSVWKILRSDPELRCGSMHMQLESYQHAEQPKWLFRKFFVVRHSQKESHVEIRMTWMKAKNKFQWTSGWTPSRNWQCGKSFYQVFGKVLEVHAKDLQRIRMSCFSTTVRTRNMTLPLLGLLWDEFRHLGACKSQNALHWCRQANGNCWHVSECERIR